MGNIHQLADLQIPSPVSATPMKAFGPAGRQAALVAALEITRHLAVLAAGQQFTSNALHDLVTSTPANVGDAVAHAASFRWDLQRPRAVLVARRLPCRGWARCRW